MCFPPNSGNRQFFFPLILPICCVLSFSSSATIPFQQDSDPGNRGEEISVLSYAYTCTVYEVRGIFPESASTVLHDENARCPIPYLYCALQHKCTKYAVYNFLPAKTFTAFIRKRKNVTVLPLSAISTTNLPLSGQTHPKIVFLSLFR